MNRHRCECSICTERGDEIGRLQDAKRAALKLADERAKEANKLRQVVDWVDTWVNNPVGSYSVAALDGLFAMTRDRIAALTDEQRKQEF